MNTAEMLAAIAKLRVLIVGDLALDRWCRYDPALADVSRETGIPRIAVVAAECTPGAAGTVAGNVAALGAQATLLSAIGPDGYGFEVRRALRERGIEDRLVEWPGFATFTYTKLINARTGAEDLPRVDFVNPRALPRELEGEIVRRFAAEAPAFDLVLVSDQAETPEGGIVTPVLREAIAHFAEESPARLVWVDSRLHTELFRGVIVKPNRAEAEAASKRALGRIDFAGLRRLLRAPLLFVTQGEEGVAVVGESGSEFVPARRIARPVDICGAGDSFTAGAALAFQVTGDAIEAARFGNLVASITVMKRGTGTASPAEVLAASE